MHFTFLPPSPAQPSLYVSSKYIQCIGSQFTWFLRVPEGPSWRQRKEKQISSQSAPSDCLQIWSRVWFCLRLSITHQFHSDFLLVTVIAFNPQPAACSIVTFHECSRANHRTSRGDLAQVHYESRHNIAKFCVFPFATVTRSTSTSVYSIGNSWVGQEMWKQTK